jgi:hypothetical protein
MRNYEIIKEIYKRCPDMVNREYSTSQLFDRCQDIRDMIERERPEMSDGVWEEEKNDKKNTIPSH